MIYFKFYLGCHCWFDPLEKYLGKKKCACCKSNGIQCGYPMHKWCQPKVKTGKIQKGCIGEILLLYISLIHSHNGIILSHNCFILKIPRCS